MSSNFLKANQICDESALLIKVGTLPFEILELVGSFSPVVQNLKKNFKFNFFDSWIIDNTDRIMEILNGWTKPQVGFVLNSIIQLDSPEFVFYLKGGRTYKHWTSEYMRKQIKVHISHRTEKMRPDIIADLNGQTTYVVHKFVKCKVNPTFDECPPIRIWGAYKAIEEYNARLKLKKGKNGKKK
jgi:hypothetical protein